MKKNQIEMILKAHEAGEPTFTFRAQDLFSLYSIGNYIDLLESYPEATNPEHIAGVKEIYQEFLSWREANETKIKIPD